MTYQAQLECITNTVSDIASGVSYHFGISVASD